MVVADLSVGEGEATVDLEGLTADVSALGLDRCVVDALDLEPGNRKCRSRCGGMLCGNPAAVAYRASSVRTPRMEYGFFHEDSNR